MLTRMFISHQIGAEINQSHTNRHHVLLLLLLRIRNQVIFFAKRVSMSLLLMKL